MENRELTLLEEACGDEICESTLLEVACEDEPTACRLHLLEDCSANDAMSVVHTNLKEVVEICESTLFQSQGSAGDLRVDTHRRGVWG